MSSDHSQAAPTAAEAVASTVTFSRLLLVFFFGSLVTVLFFRNVLPRLPRLFLRGRLRLQRAGLRGIHGLEYRSQGFNDSAAFSKNPERSPFELKIRRLYASCHLPSRQKLSSSNPDAAVRPRRRAIFTIHVQGVGVRIPKLESEQDADPSGPKPQHPVLDQDLCLQDEHTKLEREEEERLQRLMNSPPISPSSEAAHSFFSSALSTPISARRNSSVQVGSAAHPALAVHRAGTWSFLSILNTATWLRCTLIPSVRSLLLRIFRAALFLLTSSLPVLTSLVSIEIDRVEVYVQEAEAVVRIGRAGITFAMSADSRHADQVQATFEQHEQVSNTLSVPTWAQFVQTVRNMPTRVGSGARGAVSYLAAGISPSKASVYLRLESILVFESQFPDHIPPTPEARSRRSSVSGFSSPSFSDSDPFRPDLAAVTTEFDRSDHDDSADWSDSPSTPKIKRSNSASRLSRMSASSLRGFTDRWADWALEPLSNSAFSTDTGWATKYLEADMKRERLSQIPRSATLLSSPGLSEISAGILLGSNLAIGGDSTLNGKLGLGDVTIGLDSVLRILKILENSKARRRGSQPRQHRAEKNSPHFRSNELTTRQRHSIPSKFLAVVSSIAISLPSVHILASTSAFMEADNQNEESSPPLLALDVALTGFHFDLSSSKPSDDMHRRWLGTCGLQSSQSSGAQPAHKSGPLGHKLHERSERRILSRKKILKEHRRAFLFDVGVASLDVRSKLETQQRSSQLLVVADLSLILRSTWTPFGFFMAPQLPSDASRLLFVGDPNEHAAVLEASLAEIKSELSLEDLAALLRIVDQIQSQRKATDARLNANAAPQSNNSLDRLRRVPRIAAGFHVQRISIMLDASKPESERGDRYAERKLVLSIPHVDFTLNGEYHDEYVKRPLAEKRAAYKALRGDALEWPLSAKGSVPKTLLEGGLVAGSSQTRNAIRESDPSSLREADEMKSSSDTAAKQNRYAEENLSMDEALRRMLELERDESQSYDLPHASRRPTLRDQLAKLGKVRLPGYTRRSSMAAETRFSLRYQFETSLRLEAVETFLSFDADSQASSAPFARWQPGSKTSSDSSSQHHLLALHSFEIIGNGRVPGNVELIGPNGRIEVPWLSVPDAVAEFRSNIEDVDVEVWHPRALETYIQIAHTVSHARHFGKQKADAGDEAPASRDPSTIDPSGRNVGDSRLPQVAQQSEPERIPLVQRLPGGLNLYVSIGRTIAHLGGLDKRTRDQMIRGVGFEADRIVFEYSAVTETKSNVLHHKANWGSRSALELPEDLQLQAVSLASRHGRSALAKVVFHDAGIFPILDAVQATRQHTQGTAEEPFARAKRKDDDRRPERGVSHDDAEKEELATSLLADSVWKFQGSDGNIYKTHQHRQRFRQQDRSNFIFFVPFAALKIAVKPPELIKKPGLAGPADEEVTITTEDMNLLSFKVDLLHTYCLLLTASIFRDILRKKPEAESRNVQPDMDRKPALRKQKTGIACRFDIKDVHVSISLPKDVHLFVRLRRLEVRQDPTEGLSVGFETVMGAVESSKLGAQDLWEEAVRLRDWKVIIPPKKPDERLKLQINGDGGLVRVPFGYPVNPIIDNTSVAIKATKQLVHQLLSGKDDSIIVPEAEGPKQLPDVSINIRVLTLEAQDDPFETKLNLIWRAGHAENMAREEREAAFQAKAEAFMMNHRERSSSTLRTSGSASSRASSIRSDSDGLSSAASHGSPFSAKHAEVNLAEARVSLDAYNSDSWQRRYKNAEAEQTRKQEAVLRNIYGRFLMSRTSEELPIKVQPIGRAAPLFRSIAHGISIKVGQPTFPESSLRDFLHEKGAGTPKNTPYSLLVPMHLNWEMEEWRITLRDLPMPFFHVPPTHRTNASKTWRFEGDIVLAEQLGGPESIRHVPAVIVPAATGHPEAVEYGIVIPKVAMSVKMYGTPSVSIHSPYPTRLVWGQSIQPTIQDVMRVIDGVTPPPHDPSPKLGFWDKLPLILHGHINVQFKDEGSFNIHLKGSRDPYRIDGFAAGWVKSWKGRVELRIGYDNPEREFFQIHSHEYILAIPDLTDYVDQAATGVFPASSGADHQANANPEHGVHQQKSSYDPSLSSSVRRYMKDPTFSKIVIKLTNGVRWGAGLHGERTCDDETCPRRPKCKGEPFYRECRNFDRIPHWEVVPKTREHFNSLPESERKDSFRGWRSDHMHLSLSVYSPESGLPGFCGNEVCSDAVANNFYFTPLTWAHFWSWMRLFNSAMGLPIRTGKLFPDSPPPSPKLGRFLGTIKYKIDLAPLFITHQYMQYTKEDWARGLRTHVGIKARLGSFALDMHQRQQETIKDRPELGGPRIVFHKPFYEAEVDCKGIDLKTLAGQFREESDSLLEQDEQEMGESALTDLFAKDSPIPDRDLEWYDPEDFIELGLPTPKDDHPKIRMFPALICPQFNYYRNVEPMRERKTQQKQAKADADDSSSTTSKSRRGNEIEELLDKLEHSKFGKEPTHVCLVGKAAGPYSVQRKLAHERLLFIRNEIDSILKRKEQPNSTDRSESSSDIQDPLEAKQHDQQDEQLDDLENRAKLLTAFMSHLNRLQEHADRFDRAKKQGRSIPKRPATMDRNFSVNKHDLTSLYHDLGTFDNRYIAHNPTLFYSNATRTLLLKYYYSSRLRRGYAHHMTATAVRYIRDLLKKKDAAETRGTNRKPPSSYRQEGDSHSTPGTETDSGADILQEMLEDTVRHLETSEEGQNAKKGGDTIPNASEFGIKTMDSEVKATDGISDEFTVAKSNSCLLVKPQIVLMSEIDDRSTVILTALRTRLQNYTVRDETCAEDSVNAVVLRRTFFALDSLQCFHPSAKCRFLKNAQQRSGFVFIPIETLVDMHGLTHDFDRIVPNMDASLYYDKFNKLRLSDSSRSVATFGDDGKPLHDHLHHHMDMIQLICPRFSVSANSEHFAALYNVVTDLILYRDPAHRDHAKRLEEMMFSYDFRDVSGLADVVAALQVRIREATDLLDQYLQVSDRLNEQGKAEFASLKGEALDLVEELNLIMDAITTSQDSEGGADREKKSALRFVTQARDVAWNMMGDDAGQLLAKLAVRGISFSWLNKADNSAANTVSIVDLQALNVHPDAVFAEIITKHLRAPNHPMAKQGRFLDAMWSVLPPVGGISIIDQFEFHLHPVKIQIELILGRKIMDYVFGTKRERQRQEEEQKRIEYESSRKKEEGAVKKKSPFARLLGNRKSQSATPSDRGSAATSSVDLLASSKDTSSTDLRSLGRASSDVSRDDEQDLISGRRPRSVLNGKSRPSTPASRHGAEDSDDEKPGDQFAIARRNAAEMRSRASSYRTFVYVKISETIFCLSYKGEKQKSITDLYDLVFRTPNFEYHNCTFGYVDLADTFKKDVFKAAWNQKSTLLKEIITHRPTRKRNAIESIRAMRQASKARESLIPLDISVEPPTPVGANSGVASSAESASDAYRYGDDDDDDDDDEEEEDEDEHGNEREMNDAWTRDDGSDRSLPHSGGRGSVSPNRRAPSSHEFGSALNDSPTTERGGSSHLTFLHPFTPGDRRGSLSSRSQSPSFKLNKLLPRSLRPRSVSQATASTTEMDLNGASWSSSATPGFGDGSLSKSPSSNGSVDRH